MSLSQFNTTISDIITVRDKSNLEQALLILKQHGSTQKLDDITILLKDVPLATVELIRPFITADQNVKVVFNDYLTFVSALPVATLTLSYRPTTKQTLDFSKLLRKKIHAHLVLDIKYETTLTLGFSLDFDGKTVSRELDIDTL